MIRTLTIVENRTDDGNISYTVTGPLPLEEAAKALVIIAWNAPKPEKKGETPSDVIKGNPP